MCNVQSECAVRTEGTDSGRLPLACASADDFVRDISGAPVEHRDLMSADYGHAPGAFVACACATGTNVRRLWKSLQSRRLDALAKVDFLRLSRIYTASIASVSANTSAPRAMSSGEAYSSGRWL